MTRPRARAAARFLSPALLCAAALAAGAVPAQADTLVSVGAARAVDGGAELDVTYACDAGQGFKDLLVTFEDDTGGDGAGWLENPTCDGLAHAATVPVAFADVHSVRPGDSVNLNAFFTDSDGLPVQSTETTSHLTVQ
ncbi:hypothetical protein QD712_29470 [Streptomyces acidiscabies]|uniref:hypothetical protein n=1 Tax=Streptomyces acidiscabies TaxID=42234 RepID=UPI0030D4E945